MVRQILKLIRIFNCLITFLTVFVGCYIISKSVINITLVLSSSLAAFFIAAGGNVINDVFDIENDKIAHPERPLASNKISKNKAIIIYSLLNLLSIGILSTTNFYILLLAVTTIFVLFLYSCCLKKIFLLSNIIIAFLTGLTFIYSGVVVNNIKDSLIPALFAFLINLIREIVKDIQDISGDKNFNVNSLPIILGVDKTREVILVLLIILVVSTFIPFMLEIYNIYYLAVIMIFVNPILFLCLLIIIKGTKSDNLRKVSDLLKINMLFGLIAIYLGK